MFSGMTSAETLGWFSIILLIGVPAVAMLASWAAFRWPGHDARAVYESGSLGVPGAYREPAEPAYVDTLMRVQGRAYVFHKPDPPLADPDLLATEPVRERDPHSPFNVTLAQLVDSAKRYAAPANAPVSPARHASGVVDTATRASTSIGRHRALPELVAA